VVRVTALGSGSKGNSLVVALGDTRIAIDAGFGPRTLAKKLRACGIAPQSIQVCVITHEHLDHVQGAVSMRDKWQWTLAATPPTLAAIGVARATARVRPMPYRAAEMFGPVRVTLLPVSHDAVAPAAVLLEDTRSGARIGVTYDLGEIPAGLAEHFARLDVLVLEANHDMGMLRNGPYPPMLQERIAGRRGHLSNAQSAEFAACVAHKDLRAVMLAHLSQENNTPALARGAVGRALRTTPFRGTLVTAAQHTACMVGTAAAEQLSLF
jgi:phosphoribosyl 1,2-cyclic phosphodiesterase